MPRTASDAALQFSGQRGHRCSSTLEVLGSRRCLLPASCGPHGPCGLRDEEPDGHLTPSSHQPKRLDDNLSTLLDDRFELPRIEACTEARREQRVGPRMEVRDDPVLIPERLL